MVNSTLEEDDLWYFGDRKNLKRRYMNKNLVYCRWCQKERELNTYIL